MSAYVLGGRALHFPFLSGILSYSCEGCDAPCCKITPLGIGRSRELLTLGKAQPHLALFTTPGFHGSPMLSVQPPREGCWFLDGKSRCRLEARIGRDAKPAGCRLFPFQRVRALGSVLTVLPDFTCPLRVEDRPSDQGPTSHDVLTLEMHRVKVPARGHPQLPAPSDFGSWDKAAHLEGQVVRRANRYLEAARYLGYAVKQAELTARALETELQPGTIADLERRVRRRLGLEGPPSPGPVRDLVALTGVLRLMTSSLPRNAMPGMLLATAALLEAYEEMYGVERTARTVISLYEQRLPLIYVLGHLRDRPVLKKGADPKRLLAGFPAVRSPLLKALQAIVDNRGRVSRPLDAILDEQEDVFAPPLSFDAVAMLYALGRVLLKDGEFR